MGQFACIAAEQVFSIGVPTGNSIYYNVVSHDTNGYDLGVLYRRGYQFVQINTSPYAMHTFAVDHYSQNYYKATITHKALMRYEISSALATDYELALSTDHVLVCVDSRKMLWAFNRNTNDNNIYRYYPDMTDKFTYSVKSGLFGTDQVTAVGVGLLEDYIYVAGTETDNAARKVCKFSINNLDGGDPEWTYARGPYTDQDTITSIVVNRNDHVYANITGDNNNDVVICLDSDGNELFTHATKNCYNISVASDDALFVIATDSSGKNVARLDAVTGATEAVSTDNYPNPQRGCCLAADESYLYVLGADPPGIGTDRGVYAFDMSSYLTDGEDWNYQAHGANILSYTVVPTGDVSGHVNKFLTDYYHDNFTFTDGGSGVLGSTDTDGTPSQGAKTDPDYSDTVNSDSVIISSDVPDINWRYAGFSGYGDIAVDIVNNRFAYCDISNNKIVITELHGSDTINVITDYSTYSIDTPDGLYYSGDQLYVCDRYNHALSRFDRYGGYIDHFGTHGTAGNTTSTLNNPNGVCGDGQHIYIVDRQNQRVVKLDQETLTYVTDSTAIFADPVGVTVLDDSVYVADWYVNQVIRLDKYLDKQATIGGTGTDNAYFAHPHHLTNDGTYLYVADTGNDRIQCLQTDGTFVSVLVTDGSGDYRITAPYGITWYDDNIIFSQADVTTALKTWYQYQPDETSNSWTLEKDKNDDIDWTDETEVDTSSTEETAIDSSWTEETAIDSTWTQES